MDAGSQFSGQRQLVMVDVNEINALRRNGQYLQASAGKDALGREETKQRFRGINCDHLCHLPHRQGIQGGAQRLAPGQQRRFVRFIRIKENGQGLAYLVGRDMLEAAVHP